jgi:hypothetical protein
MKYNSKFLFLLTLNLLSVAYFYNMDDVDAQINETQTLIQQNPGVIELQPPIDAETGEVIELPGTIVAIKDPVTGQLITKEIKLQPPKVTGPSLSSTSTTTVEPLLDPNPGLLSTVPNSPIGHPNAVFGLTTSGQGSGIGVLSSTVNPTLSTTMPLYVTKPMSTLNPDISEILNNPSEVIDWDRTESVIAVKAELGESGVECNKTDCFDKKIDNMTILVKTFMNNSDGILTEFRPSELYKFVHIPSEKWEGPAILMDIELMDYNYHEVKNYTKSSMCNTYIELGKLYKCNITIK